MASNAIPRIGSVGALVILTHLLIYYAIPGLQYYLFPHIVVTTFVRTPLTAYGLAFLAIVISWLLILARTNLVAWFARLSLPRYGAQLLAAVWWIYPYVRAVLAAVMFVLSIVFAFQGLFFYRYSGASLGLNVSPIVAILVILRAWSMADFLLIVLSLLCNRDFGQSAVWRLPTLIIAMSWVCAVNGSASAIYGGLFLYVAILPGFFRDNLLTGWHWSRQTMTLQKAGIRLFAFLLLVGVLFVGWQAGNAVKTLATDSLRAVPGDTLIEPFPSETTVADGSPPTALGEGQAGEAGTGDAGGGDAQSTTDVQKTMETSVPNFVPQAERNFSWLNVSPAFIMDGYAERLMWLPARLGVGFYSFGVITSEVDVGLYNPGTAWSVIGRNLLFRWSNMLRLPNVERPDIRSIGQLNYRNIERPDLQNDRSGASPGVLAAMSYLFPRPLDILAAVAYIGLICVSFARVTGPYPRPISLVGYLLLIIMAQEFFLNPADYLLIADGGFVFFASFMILAEAANAGRLAHNDRSVLDPSAPASDPSTL